MVNGVLPVKPDHRDYSFSRTFGTTTVVPDRYDCDAGLTMPDQVKDGRENGCTAYTQTELCGDEDGAVYDPGYTYKQTLFMMDAPDGSPCDMRQSLTSTIVYGVKGEHESETDAYSHRRGKYFSVVDDPNLDYFDEIRSVMWLNRLMRRSVSVATPWFHQWNKTGKEGIVGDFDEKNLPSVWHNWKISGWKSINGVPYLIGKSWQGKKVGDEGWLYFSRERINKLMSIQGTAGYTLAQIDDILVNNVRLSILSTLLSYYYRLLALIRT